MCELGTAHLKTDPATTKYKRYNAAFKHSAVEDGMLSGKSARIIAGEPAAATGAAADNAAAGHSKKTLGIISEPPGNGLSV